MPNLFVIAGPNGAGKSTSAPELLTGARRVDEFVNADVIASARRVSDIGIRNDAFQPLAAAANSSHAAGGLFVSSSLLVDSACGPGGAARRRSR